MVLGAWAVLAVATPAPALAPPGRAAGEPSSRWTAPASIGACPATGAPRVVFPSDTPEHPTGTGALVWAASGACPGGAGARVAVLGPGEVPRAAAIPHLRSGAPLAPQAPLSVSSSPHGTVTIAGSAAGHGEQSGLVIQGPAGGPFAPLAGSAAARVAAITTAYLGDLALGTASPGRIALHVQRYFARSVDRGVEQHVSAGEPVTALTVAMDYRSDAIAVWDQNGSIYARDLPASGARHATQRLGPAGTAPQVAVLLSDDNRAIVMWVRRQGNRDSVYLDYSATGVRFGAPQALERFQAPPGASPAASPLLTRLSSESVMCAWAGVSAGHWVLRTAAIDQRGLQHVSTISQAGADLLLSALAPGPSGEAIVLWSTPTQAGAGSSPEGAQALYAARGIDAAPGHTIFAAPELVAPAGTVTGATLAIDPGSGDALAAWQGQAGTIHWSVRPAEPSAASARAPAADGRKARHRVFRK